MAGKTNLIPQARDWHGRPIKNPMVYQLCNFFAQIDEPNEHGCREWMGYRTPVGYGNFRLNGEALAHRVSFVLAHGSISPGKCVLHRCDNPPCVNPDHLFEGTMDDNMQDCKNKGRRPRGENASVVTLTEALVRELRSCDVPVPELAEKWGISQFTLYRARNGITWGHIPGACPRNPASADKTHCKWNHEFTKANTYITPAGVRQCRACWKRRKRDRKIKSQG